MGKERVSRMDQAEKARQEIIGVISEGETGRQVFFSLDVASLLFRVDRETLLKMGQRGQELGVSIKGERVAVALSGGEVERRQSYRFFYGLLQAVKQGAGETFLAVQTQPSSLKEIPGIEETLAVIKKGKCDLPDEEMLRLQIHLLGNWLSLKDKSDLPAPEVVFSSLS